MIYSAPRLDSMAAGAYSILLPSPLSIGWLGGRKDAATLPALSGLLRPEGWGCSLHSLTALPLSYERTAGRREGRKKVCGRTSKSCPQEIGFMKYLLGLWL